MLRHFSDSPVEREKKRLGPMLELLARHGVWVRGNRVRCVSPDHIDIHPSASVYGDERLHCFSCGFDGDVLDVARALGETVELHSSSPLGYVQEQESRPDWLARAFADAVAARPEFVFEWEATKLLATLPGYWARVEVANNFDYLRARGDVRLMLKGSYLLRGAARLRLCNAKSRDDEGAVTDAVRRLLQRVAA
ncbi:hypothetical protein BH20ACT21_BH20ACT21_00010 [soil metagenome]